MAWRYLRGAESGREDGGRGFLRFVVYVSIGGVAVGVAALLLALAIVRGFSSEIEKKIVGFGAHVQVESYLNAPLDGAGRLERALADLPHVQAVAPTVIDFALLRRSHTEIDGVALWGVRTPPPYLEEQLTAGRFRFAPDSSGHPGAVLGKAMAQRLNLDVGDVVTVFSMPGDAEPSDAEGEGAGVQSPRVKQFHVAGLYETSLSDFDDLYVFTRLDAARALAGFSPDEVTRLDLTLDRAQRADSVAALVQDRFDFPVGAVTIFQAFSGLFAWVNLQQSIIPLVLGVIIVVAAFNIIGALLMLTVEKTREMGVLSSLGASPKRIRRLFVGLGLLIGTVGTAIGASLALVLALLQQRYELIPLPAEAYYMTSAPVELHALDFVLVSVVAVLLCAAASYVPARVAARIDPVRAIRFR